MLLLKYTHRKKLGNTFSPLGKCENFFFPFLLSILKFVSHIYLVQKKKKNAKFRFLFFRVNLIYFQSLSDSKDLPSI